VELEKGFDSLISNGLLGKILLYGLVVVDVLAGDSPTLDEEG
jgi:hypothetical protein